METELGTTSLASVIDHRHRTRSSTRRAFGEAAVENAALAFGAAPPKAVTFTEGFLGDTEAFFRAMDSASHGHFLREPVAPVGKATVPATGSGSGGAPCSSVGDNTIATKNNGLIASKPSDGGVMAKKGKSSSSSLSPAGSLLAELGLVKGNGGLGAKLSAGSVAATVAAAAAGSSGSGNRCDGGEDWVQSSWLAGMGGFTLAAFLANR